MKIGIDIDDTTFITVEAMIKYADKYDKEVLKGTGTNGKLGLIKDRYYLRVLYGWKTEEKYNFFNMYYKNVLEECTLMPNANTVCQQLKKEGHEIYFITARLTNITNCNTEEITKNALKENNIPYNELIINARDKLKICEEKGINIFIEDSYETCRELQDKGIKSILMTTKMNEEVENKDIVRVNNWNEVYEEIEKFMI